MKAITLVKYEGAGNDFLVAFDEPPNCSMSELARAVCDRHRGVGADGLLLVEKLGPGELSMRLWNADGSIAETSGNGLRCAVLAASDAGLTDSDAVMITTLAGRAKGELLGRDASTSSVRVEMGVVEVHELNESPVPGARAFGVDTGNPHLVLLGEATKALDLLSVGEELSRSVPGEQNVELVSLSKDVDSLELRVYERGVGITDACGSGSCAAGVVAFSLGLVGESVVVHNPGGPLVVELSGDKIRPNAALVGPARRIAHVELAIEDLIGQMPVMSAT